MDEKTSPPPPTWENYVGQDGVQKSLEDIDNERQLLVDYMRTHLTNEQIEGMERRNGTRLDEFNAVGLSGELILSAMKDLNPEVIPVIDRLMKFSNHLLFSGNMSNFMGNKELDNWYTVRRETSAFIIGYNLAQTQDKSE